MRAYQVGLRESPLAPEEWFSFEKLREARALARLYLLGRPRYELAVAIVSVSDGKKYHPAERYAWIKGKIARERMGPTTRTRWVVA